MLARSLCFLLLDFALVQDRSLQLLTGPNQAGKSTYLATLGVLAVLAHAGSLVPARFAAGGDCAFARRFQSCFTVRCMSATSAK